MEDESGEIRTDQTGADKPARKSRAPLWGLVALGVVVVAAAVIIPVSISAAERAAEEEAQAQAAAAEKERLGTFARVIESCDAAGGNVRVLDGGETLELSRVTKYDGPSYSEMSCLLSELDAPAAVESAIGQTRALDGRQHDEWAGYEVAWAYHPDDGASILIEHAR
ncbi:hypothetical protein [Microbacterium arborescens]